jgi:hypothetical protein
MLWAYLWITQRRRRGSAAPTPPFAEATTPDGLNGRAREARPSGFIAQSAQHFARSE